jgi:hypothetical protein
MSDIKTKQAVLKGIKVMLQNRRRCFFTIHPNAQKQQIILEAERHLWQIENVADESFAEKAKRYADYFVVPLIPTQISRYYNHYQKLYTQIKSLN